MTESHVLLTHNRDEKVMDISVFHVAMAMVILSIEKSRHWLKNNEILNRFESLNLSMFCVRRVHIFKYFLKNIKLQVGWDSSI